MSRFSGCSGYMHDEIKNTGSRGHTRYDTGCQLSQIGNVEVGRIRDSQFFGMITSERSATPFADARVERLMNGGYIPKPQAPQKLRLYDPEGKVFYE